jgi:hypothetical protein
MEHIGIDVHRNESCGIGSESGRCLSAEPYVTGDGGHGRAPAAGGC